MPLLGTSLSMKKIAPLFLCLFLVGCQAETQPIPSASAQTATVEVAQSDQTGLPQVREGFKVEKWADVPNARSLALSPDGKTLFVGSREGFVHKITISESGPQVEKFQENVDGANGVCFVGEDLYLGELERVRRFSPPDGFDPNAKGEVVLEGLPPEKHHGWRYIKGSPDGRIYIGIGAPCNVCEKEDPRFASICSFTADGQDFRVEAKGVRNSVGFDWHPESGDFYFTDNGRDMLGDDIPPCELNILQKGSTGKHYGFPYRWGDNQPDPQYGDQAPSGVEFTKPLHNFQAHVAPLGCHFPKSEALRNAFPSQVLVAQHGSWNRSTPIGYRVVTVNLDKPEEPAEPLLWGFLNQDGTYSGRPVDILELPDGKILVSDDYKDVIWSVTKL